MTAANHLTAIAFERAITGTPRQVWRDGQISAETSVPSDRMLLLRQLNPALFSHHGERARAAAIEALQQGFAGAIAALVGTDVDADLLDVDDLRPHPPAAHKA